MRRAACGCDPRGGALRPGSGVGWRAVLVMGTMAVGLAACNRPSAPLPPGGGVPLPLDYPSFRLRVEPILQTRGCSTTACHGGQGSGQMLLSGGSSPEADFDAVSPLTRPLDVPPLARKPLAVAAGGLVHGGGDIFADTADADYRALVRWIAGEKLP